MAGITTIANAPALVPQFWDRFLLDNTYPDLYMYQFAEKHRLPRQFGRFVNYTKYYKLAQPGSLTEGTAISLSALSAQRLTASVAGYGMGIGISDLIVMSGVSDTVRGAVFELSKAMASKINSIVLAAVSASGLRIAANNSASTATSLITTALTLATKHLFKSVAALRQANTRTWPDGAYVATLHPAQGFNVRSDTATGSWVDVNKYASDSTVGLIYRGEVGKVGGIRVVESSAVKQIFGAPISAANSGFLGLGIGPGAYGVVELDGAAATVFIKQVGSAGTADLINQRGGVGVKVYIASFVQDANRMVRIVSGGRTII